MLNAPTRSVPSSFVTDLYVEHAALMEKDPCARAVRRKQPLSNEERRRGRRLQELLQGKNYADGLQTHAALFQRDPRAPRAR